MPKGRVKDYLLLLLAVLAGFWFLFVYAAQNDFLDCWLPWRHFTSQSFHNGIFPLWNPYQQLGYPAYADLQGPVLSFENFITGSWLKLDLTTLQLIFFGYVYMAAVGMYELGRYLYQNTVSSVIIAIAYVCGSFFIHHQQHFFSVVSAACAPLTLVFILKFLHSPKWKYVWPLVVLFHVQFTTGNQTFNIINLHILAILFIARVIKLYQQKNKPTLHQLRNKTIALVGFTLLVILPVLIAWWQTKEEVARYAGMTYEKATMLHMTWPAFWSYLNPFISGAPTAFTQTDPAMAGHFVGWGILTCAVAYFITTKSTTKWILLATVGLFTLLALGPLTPFHRFVFSIDPLLQLFRFPAYYMFYVNFILLIAAGYFITKLLHYPNKQKWLIYGYTVLLIIALIAVLLFGWNKGHIFYDLRTSNGFVALKQLSVQQVFSFSLIVVLLFTLGWLILFWLKKIKPIVVLTVFSLELLLVINLSMLQMGSGRTTAAIDEFMQNRSEKFTVPPNKLYSFHDLLDSLPPDIWRNYHTFLNVVSPDFFNSFYLKKITGLDSTQTLRDSLYKQPLWSASTNTPVACLRFDPSAIELKVNTLQACTVQVMQINHRFWQMKVNGKPQAIPRTTVLSCSIPQKGQYTIEYSYHNPAIVNTTFLSWLMVLIGLIGCLFFYLNRNWFVVSSTLLLITFCGAVLQFF